MIKLKSSNEINVLKTGGKILASILGEVKKQAKPGVTTAGLNELAENMIREKGGEPSFLNFGSPPYPAGLCTSVNEELVHGIPKEYILKSGDLLSLDVGMRYPAKSGLYTDMAVTIPIGKVSKEAKELMKVTKKALDIWINNISAGENLNDIARKIEKFVELHGFAIVRDLVGHGVGSAVHEEPQIPNYYIPNMKVELKEGMVLALEPMVSSGDYRVKTLDDSWTVVTRDHSLCAHFEHTVVVTRNGCEILTK